MKKTFKKLMAALLAVALLCAMAVPAFAASAHNNGKITINQATDGETYTIYRIFDLESYDKSTGEGDPGRYSYTVSQKWIDAGFTNSTAFTNYFTLVNNKYVKANDSMDAAAFAKAALAFAEEKIIANDGSHVAASGKVEFASLPTGYYLINTTVGTLCALDTTNDTIVIDDKNVQPTIDKTVKNGTGDYVKSNDASIGDKVEYKVVIYAKKGATGYVLTDTMTEGLTFNNDIAITDDNNKTLTSGIDYTMTSAVDSTTGVTTITVTFKPDYLNTLTNDSTDITVTYSATLNKDAVVYNGTNKNTAKLKYGHDAKTTTSETDTYTYMFDLVKTDSTNKLLADAKFKLYDSSEGGNVINLVADGDNAYRVAVNGEAGVEIVTNAASKITIKGLKKGTYWLQETEAPQGYNGLTARVEVDLTGGNNVAKMDNTTYVPVNNAGIHIVNNTGATLPSTGGMGTTLFYVIGGGLMVAAVVLLVTKKRMENK
mgnify:FL=1